MKTALLMLLAFASQATPATKLVLQNDASAVQLGTSTYLVKRCNSTQGDAGTNTFTATHTGPLTGQYWPSSNPDHALRLSDGQWIVWLSDPLSAAVTISGTITPNLWGNQNDAAAHAGARYEILRWSAADGGIHESLGISAHQGITEWPTYPTGGVRNEPTLSPASTAFNTGDRILIVIYSDDASGQTQSSGYYWNLNYNAAGAGWDGDTYLSFTETITFSADTNNAPARGITPEENNTMLNLTATAAAKAAAVLTVTGAPAAGKHYIIGTHVYTVAAALSIPAIAYELLLDSAAGTLDNLKAAVNRATGEGVTYGNGTVAHPDVEATTNTDTQQTFAARIPGAFANAIPISTDAALATFDHATLFGGADASDKLTKTQAIALPEVSTQTLGQGYLFILIVSALTADKHARIALNDGTTGAEIHAHVVDLLGPINQPKTITVSFRDLPGLARGSGKFAQLELLSLDANASVTFAAFLSD